MMQALCTRRRLSLCSLRLLAPFLILIALGTSLGIAQDATGALQAAQAGNQLVALQTRQLADLTALMAAQNRAASIAAASLANPPRKRQRGRESSAKHRA